MALDLLQILITTVHFIAANLAAGGPLLALWLDRRSRRGDPDADRAGRVLLRASLIGLYVGVAVGALAAYGWWQIAPPNVERAVRALPRSRYEFGVLELVFSAICWELWLRFWSNGSRRRLGWWLGFLGATNVVYHFPTLFAVLAVLSERSAKAPASVRFVSMLADVEVLGRTMHFVVASLAAAGAVTMYLLVRAPDVRDGRQQAEALKRRAARVALVATLLQFPIGIAVLLTLPEASRSHLLGDDPTASGLFGLSLAAVVVLLHHLVAASFGTTSRREARSVLLWLGVILILMTAVRHYARKPLYHSGPIAIMATHDSATRINDSYSTTSDPATRTFGTLSHYGARTSYDHRPDHRLAGDGPRRLRLQLLSLHRQPRGTGRRPLVGAEFRVGHRTPFA